MSLNYIQGPVHFDAEIGYIDMDLTKEVRIMKVGFYYGNVLGHTENEKRKTA